MRADTITLLGRQVAAGPVGVGQTRSPNSVSTPTDDRTTANTPPPGSNVAEGTIRQINLDEGRIMIQNANRRMITIKIYRNTPVFFRGEQHTDQQPRDRRPHPRRRRPAQRAGR